jgi:hypothetical protein
VTRGKTDPAVYTGAAVVIAVLAALAAWIVPFVLSRRGASADAPSEEPA